jgi:hypothetical protein
MGLTLQQYVRRRIRVIWDEDQTTLILVMLGAVECEIDFALYHREAEISGGHNT